MPDELPFDPSDEVLAHPSPVPAEVSGDDADLPLVHEPRPSSDPPPSVEPSAPRLRVRGGWRSSTAIAAAATAGALVAFGLRDDGGVFAVFTAAGRLMLGIAPTQGAAASTLAFVAGFAVHVAVCALWAALFVLVASRRRPWQLAITAALLATALYSASTLWLPRLLQLGYALRATRPQRVVLYALLAGGLWAGTRLAQLASRDA